MVEVRTTPEYDKWFSGLRDRAAKQRINIRIKRVELGKLGDIKPVGGGVSELRIHYGPGYRIYVKQVSAVILLCGGTKKTQAKDIGIAKQLAALLEIDDENQTMGRG